MDFSGQLYAPVALSPEKDTPLPIEKNTFSLPVIEPRTFQLIVLSLYRLHYPSFFYDVAISPVWIRFVCELYASLT
jgi:hypothetical protein